MSLTVHHGGEVIHFDPMPLQDKPRDIVLVTHQVTDQLFVGIVRLWNSPSGTERWLAAAYLLPEGTMLARSDAEGSAQSAFNALLKICAEVRDGLAG